MVAASVVFRLPETFNCQMSVVTLMKDVVILFNGVSAVLIFHVVLVLAAVFSVVISFSVQRIWLILLEVSGGILDNVSLMLTNLFNCSSIKRSQESSRSLMFLPHLTARLADINATVFIFFTNVLYSRLFDFHSYETKIS